MKHTEGPWSYQHSGTGEFDVVAAGGRIIILDVESEADARLIAAAPEMAALLRESVDLDMNDIPALLEWDSRVAALLAELEEHE